MGRLLSAQLLPNRRYFTLRLTGLVSLTDTFIIPHFVVGVKLRFSKLCLTALTGLTIMCPNVLQPFPLTLISISQVIPFVKLKLYEVQLAPNKIYHFLTKENGGLLPHYLPKHFNFRHSFVIISVCLFRFIAI